MEVKNKKIGICITKDIINKRKFLEIINSINSIQKISILNSHDYKTMNLYIQRIKMLKNASWKEIRYRENETLEFEKENNIDILLIIANEEIISKLANNIFDNWITKIAGYQLIKNKPIVLGIYASDGLSTNAENIGKLLNRKNYYFIPFKQPNPLTKPYFLSYDERYINKTIENALIGKQIQPILVSL